MPKILASLIRVGQPGMWREGVAYEKNSIYKITKNSDLPPVNYDEHILRPHSICHVDAPSHIVAGGKTVDDYFKDEFLKKSLFGKVTVLRFDNLVPVLNKATGHEVFYIGKEQLTEKLHGDLNLPNKIIISLGDRFLDQEGNNPENLVLVLTESAVSYLKINTQFNMFGSSWKSTDFQPGSSERPIHKALFEKDVLIIECLNLKGVKEGNYFLSAFPLPLVGASESPVCPVLFEEHELHF